MFAIRIKAIVRRVGSNPPGRRSIVTTSMLTPIIEFIQCPATLHCGPQSICVPSATPSDWDIVRAMRDQHEESTVVVLGVDVVLTFSTGEPDLLARGT